tara:strand:+ start:4612 stop:5214 length:603 start_codon:yes stop_codon:yes gene_type:complete
MANVHMAFILTDSAQRYFDKDDKEAVEVVKIANISPDDMSEYSPFALFYCVDEVCTRNGLTVKGIMGDSQQVEIEGFIKRGILPLPQKETLAVGDSYTADGIFSLSSDGSTRTQGSVIITEIITGKTVNDLKPILNAMQKLGSEFGRKMEEFNMAEDVMDDDGLLMKAEDEGFNHEDYEIFMAELGVQNYPINRMYLPNV